MIINITKWRSRGGGTAVARTLFDAEAPHSSLLCIEEDAPEGLATQVAEREFICRPWDIGSAIRLTRDLLRTSDRVLVHSHGRRAGFHARAIKLRFGNAVPVVHSFHGIASFSGPKKWLSTLSESALSIACDAVVADGPAELALFRTVPLFCASRLIMPAFNPANVATVSLRPLRRLGMAARITLPKLHEQLIEVVAAYNAQTRTPVQLVIVGDGPDAARIAQLGRSRLGEHFEFLGHVADMAAFHASLDAFALFTRFEGMPLALLDAMACGLPCIATNVIGCRDLITDGQTGLLAPVDDVAGGVRALARLVEDDALRVRVGAAARNSVLERNSPERFVSDHLQLFRSLGYGT